MTAAYLRAPAIAQPAQPAEARTDDHCTGKHRFPTEASARRAQHRVSRHRERAVNAYRCARCSCWHVGSQMASHLPERLRALKQRSSGGGE
jgi:phage FluMu gp28-like protein